MSAKRRVCVRVIPDTLSKGIHRVAVALKRYAPDWVEIVDNPDEADLRIGHFIGYEGVEEWCAKGPYAVMQYCLRTTTGTPEQWYRVWRNADLTWSYYDLPSYLQEAGVSADALDLYIAPLGVDVDVFRPGMITRKPYLIGTSGYIAETEGVLECLAATRRLGRRMFHLGPEEMALGPDVVYALHIPDVVVADYWAQCNFVAGLRRIEGFELPALEGLACGARPIMFDAPHYRHWFGEHAEYVKERAPADVTEDLYSLMSKPVRVVTPAERTLIAQTFSWQPLVTKFWEALR